MSPYEKMLEQMRGQSKKESAPRVRLAEMTGKKSCRLDGLKLDAEDLLCADHIADDLSAGDTVLVCRVSEEQYAIIERLVEMDVPV